MKRIAVLIKRKNYYRPLGPIVEEALRRGHRVECWHDYSQPRGGVWASEFPDVAAVPRFPSGAPNVIPFVGLTDLGERFEADPPDAVVCNDPPPSDIVALSKARWFWMQFAADLVLHPGAPRGVQDATTVGMFSKWWTQQLQKNFPTSLRRAEVKRKTEPVGMPMLDLVRTIDPDRVRWTYSLPRHQPLVLYLPFPWRAFPQRPVMQKAFRRAPRLVGAVDRVLGPPRSDRQLVDALRVFCERSGSALIVKSRLKDRSPTYLRRAARAYFEREQNYPPVILELLACASLCVHHYSTAVLESVFCGVPSLCLGPDPHVMGLDRFNGTLIHNGKASGIYNRPGAAYWRSLGEAFEGLPRWGLADFPLAAPARREYVKRFLGFDDHHSSARFLDVVERARG